MLAEGKSLLNTPPTFAIYMVKLVTDWLINEIGGLDKMAELNRRKATMLYDVIDRLQRLLSRPCRAGLPSIMNIPFRLANPAHDEPFVKQAPSAAWRTQGPSLRRRLPGVDLQRHAHRRRPTAPRLHARVLRRRTSTLGKIPLSFWERVRLRRCIRLGRATYGRPDPTLIERANIGCRARAEHAGLASRALAAAKCSADIESRPSR